MPALEPSSSSSGTKRGAAHRDGSVSPPPLKRKAQSALTKSAVTAFFTPASQKKRDPVVWTERSPDDDTPPTLLVAKYVPERGEDQPLSQRRKIAAFDLDSTLITSASGKKHADSATDWKWWDRSVPGRLKQLYDEEGYRVVILSNQGGLALQPDPQSKAPKNLGKNRLAAFKQKCSAVLSQLDIPVTLYAATGRDLYRKPRTGMWREMCEDYDLREASAVDWEGSFFVGDAGGRTARPKAGAAPTAVPKDFSCSDRNFAHNVGVRYMTPEEFFLGEPPREFARDLDLVDYPFPGEGGGGDPAAFEKKNEKELVLFCGPPGAGKSTFYWKHLEPLGYERVNQDTLKSREKCFVVAAQFLRDGSSVAVDNTNPDPDTRAQWVEFARKHRVPVRCVWFRTPIQLCEHNDVVRALNQSLNPESRQALPKLAFHSFTSRFQEPKRTEGFQDIVEVEFKFRGTREEYEIWGKYWL